MSDGAAHISVSRCFVVALLVALNQVLGQTEFGVVITAPHIES